MFLYRDGLLIRKVFFLSRVLTSEKSSTTDTHSFQRLSNRACPSIDPRPYRSWGNLLELFDLSLAQNLK